MRNETLYHKLLSTSPLRNNINCTAPTIVFSVDVEDWFHGVSFRSAPASLADRLEVGLEKIWTLLAERNMKGTFFWLGDAAKQRPDLLRMTQDLGHEVALHSHHHTFIYNSTPDRFHSEVSEAKDWIEQKLGVRMRGFRAPFFSITKKSLWAIEVLESLGFEYDSSIIPFRHYHYGIADAPPYPYRRGSASTSLLELPVATVRHLGLRIPASGGAYARIYPYWFSKSNLLRYQESGFLPVYYCHPWEYDPDQPVQSMQFFSQFLHYHKLKSAEQNLRRLMSDFRCITMAEYAEGLCREGGD